MTDIWVCGSCHSINRKRNPHCYKCGAAQEVAATGEMATYRQEVAIASRSIVAYRPAAGLGLAASVFLLGVAAVSLIGIIESVGLSAYLAAQLDAMEATGTLDEAAFDARVAYAGRLGLLSLAIVVPALVLFAAWLSRVVSNVPALGGGIPGTSPVKAFIQTLTPVVNLKTVPGTIQDVLYRLDPTAGGLFMVAIAWIGLVGSYILSVVAGRYLDLRITFDIGNATSLHEAVEAARPLVTAATLLDIATGLMIAIGVLVLVMVIARIELRSRARDAEVRAVAGV